jgi:hypothetical protein
MTDATKSLPESESRPSDDSTGSGLIDQGDQGKQGRRGRRALFLAKAQPYDYSQQPTTPIVQSNEIVTPLDKRIETSPAQPLSEIQRKQNAAAFLRKQQEDGEKGA